MDSIVMQITISSRSLEGAADLIDSYGHSPHRIAQRVGLDPAALYRSDLDINGRHCSSLLEEAALVCDEPFFGAKLAQLQYSTKPTSYWQFIRSGQTIDEVLQRLADNLEQLYSKASSTTLSRHSDGVSLCCEVMRLNVKTSQYDSLMQSIELGMATLIYEMRLLLGDQWRPAYVQFRRERPRSLAILKQIFGDSLYFDQDINAFFVGEDTLNTLIPAHVASERSTPNVPFPLKADTNSQFIVEANRLILELINEGGCSLDRLTENLGISRRSLQLKLQQNQTSYRQLYASARFVMAREYLLHSSLSQCAIAERLNFSDAPAFSKFIKEQSGLSPRSYRRKKSANQQR